MFDDVHVQGLLHRNATDHKDDINRGNGQQGLRLLADV